MILRAIALALSLAARGLNAVTRLSADLERINLKYAEVLSLLAIVARADPPIDRDQIVAQCEQLFVAHGVSIDLTVGRVH